MDTTYDMYKYVLAGIRKGGNFSINIPEFNRLINDFGQDEWINSNVLYADLDQEFIDKLSSLKIITDGVFTYSERIDKTSPYVLPSIKNNTLITPVGSPVAKNYFTYPSNNISGISKTIDGINYPLYMRIQNIEFRINYLIGNSCKKTGLSDWKQVLVLRSDTEVSNKSNPFRKPSESKFYYEILNDSIRLVYDGFVEGYDMKIKYFKYPRRIFLNKQSTNSTDEQIGIPDYSGITNGSINCELHYSQRIEIADLAIRIFLERVQDNRYKSFLNELNIKANG